MGCCDKGCAPEEAKDHVTPPFREKGEPCSVCGNPTISMCPYCHKRVCASYGWSGHKDCGGAHEESCPQAKEARLGS